MVTKIKRKSNLKKRLSKPKKLTKKIRGGDNPDKCSDIIKAIHNNNIDLLEATVPQCDVNEVVTNPISSPRFKNTDLLSPIQWMSIYYNNKPWWEENSAAEKFLYETDALKKMHIPENPQAPQKNGLDLVCEFDNENGFRYFNGSVLNSEGDNVVDSYYKDRPDNVFLPQQTAAYYGSAKVLEQMIGEPVWNPAKYRQVSGVAGAPPLYLAVKGFLNSVNPRKLSKEQRYNEYLKSVKLILKNINNPDYYNQYVAFDGPNSRGYIGVYNTMELIINTALSLPYSPGTYTDKFINEILVDYLKALLIEAERLEEHPNKMQELVEEVLFLLPDQVIRRSRDVEKVEPAEMARRRSMVYDALLSVREKSIPIMGEIELKKIFMKDAENNAPYAVEYLIENKGYMTPTSVAHSRVQRRKEMVDRVATGMTNREIEKIDPKTGESSKVQKSMAHIGPDATKLIKKFVAKGGKKRKKKHRKTQKKSIKYIKRNSRSKATRKK